MFGTAVHGSGKPRATHRLGLPNLSDVPLFKKKPLSDRPILAVDIDGVISLFGFDQPIEPSRADLETAPGEFHLIDGMLHERLGGQGKRSPPGHPRGADPALSDL